MQGLHERAMKAAQNYLLCEKELLSLLIEMDEKKMFYQLGFSGMFNYCLTALKFSESQSGYFSQVAKKAKVVPELKKAIVEGGLSLSKARRITSVINSENHSLWIEKAKQLSQKELEREVCEVNPRSIRDKVKPLSQNRHEIRASLSDNVAKKLERARDLLSRKVGKVVALEEVFDAILNTYLEKNDPIQKAQRTFLRKETLRQKASIHPTVGRQPIPAPIRHAVNIRDENRCTEIDALGNRCPNTKFIHFHHTKPISEGGINTVSNLRILCSAHHAMIHSPKNKFSFGVTKVDVA